MEPVKNNLPPDEGQSLAEPRKIRLRKYRAWIFQTYLFAALLSFLFLAVLARTNAYFDLDLTITSLLQAVTSPVMHTTMVVVSWLGYAPQAPVITAAVSGALIGLGMKRAGWTALGAASLTFLANLLVKYIVARPRPDASLVRVTLELSSQSFPSSHVMFYTVFLGFLWFLAFAYLRHSWVRSAALVLLGSLVLLVGVSRIYLGEHWASDVLGGYLFASLLLSGVIAFYRKAGHSMA